MGSLIPSSLAGCGAGEIHVRDWRPRHVLLAVDGTGFAALQVASIAGKK
jgi:hypothetical protein